MGFKRFSLVVMGLVLVALITLSFINSTIDVFENVSWSKEYNMLKMMVEDFAPRVILG